MNTVEVRFIENRGIVSRAIAWGTNSLFSHVEFGTPEGTWIGAHIKGGVRERPANYCHPRRDYRYSIPLPEGKTLAEWLASLRADIGVEYDWLDIVGLAIHDRRLHRPGRVICSEFVARKLSEFYGEGRVMNVARPYFYLVTPEEIHLSPIFAGRLTRKIG